MSAEVRARAMTLLSYDPESGEFRWLVRRSSLAPKGSIAGSPDKNGHIRICIDYQSYLAHRLAWLIVHGKWPTHFIDHINGVRGDNRISNLRDVPQLLNAQNQRVAHRKNKSGFLGVTCRGRCYEASICASGVWKYLGSFATPEAAHQAYLQAKHDLHPGGTI